MGRAEASGRGGRGHARHLRSASVFGDLAFAAGVPPKRPAESPDEAEEKNVYEDTGQCGQDYVREVAE